MRLPSIEGLDFDLRKLGSRRLGRDRLLTVGRDEEEELRCDDNEEAMKLRLRLSSVFSFSLSSSHSLSDPRDEGHLCTGDGARNDGLLEEPCGRGLGGITARDTAGYNLLPPSSRSPWPASSRHWTFLANLEAFFSFSGARLYGCDARL